MSFTMKNLLEKPQELAQTQNEFALDVLKGLSGSPKTIPSRYFYDDRGSDLFRKIMAAEDYYPSCCEKNILLKHSHKIPEILGTKELNVVDLGAGDGSKSRILLNALHTQNVSFTYYPVDISPGALESLKDNFSDSMDQLEICGIVADYFSSIRWLSTQNHHPNLVLFLGSNLGNFNESDSREFLHHLWESMNDGDWLFMGFDLKKDPQILNRAYNDEHGLTRSFNLNLLTRINRELGANFDCSCFSHYGSYDPAKGAMLSYLISQKEQEVYISQLQKSFLFHAHEAIHVESSYKYIPHEIEDLTTETGFSTKALFSDSKNWFNNILLKVQKSPPDNKG